MKNTLNNARVDRATIAALGALIEDAEKHMRAYFFRPVQGAGARRSYEKMHSHEEITWIEGGHTFAASYTVQCTCGGVYASGAYSRDGKKTTLTAIRNSFNRLSAAADAVEMEKQVARIVKRNAGARELAVWDAPHELVKGETWNDAHKVVDVLELEAGPDGYRYGFAVDLVTRSIVG